MQMGASGTAPSQASPVPASRASPAARPPARPAADARSRRGYSGMLPCFFGGFRSRFVEKRASAAISFGRV